MNIIYFSSILEDIVQKKLSLSNWKQFMKKSIFSFLLLLLAAQLFAQSKETDIVGIWLNEKKEGRVELYKIGNSYYGKIVWLLDPLRLNGSPKVDENNPDKNKQNQLIVGLVVIKNLIWNGKGNWEDGTVYDPKNGKTYSTTIKLKDFNLLEITGYIGFSFIGRTETWTRIK